MKYLLHDNLNCSIVTLSKGFTRDETKYLDSMKTQFTPQQKAANTRAARRQAAFEQAEASAKSEIEGRGYGPRFYAGKCHAIEGLKPGETYRQEQFPGGYDSWQEALSALD